MSVCVYDRYCSETTGNRSSVVSVVIIIIIVVVIVDVVVLINIVDIREPRKLVGRAPDSLSKGCEFESRQERRKNFLLQS